MKAKNRLTLWMPLCRIPRGRVFNEICTQKGSGCVAGQKVMKKAA